MFIQPLKNPKILKMDTINLSTRLTLCEKIAYSKPLESLLKSLNRMLILFVFLHHHYETLKR